MRSRAIEKRATTKIFIDTRRALNNGSYPIKIRVTFERKQIYYPTPYALPLINFNTAIGIPPITDEEKKAHKQLSKATRDELKIIGLDLQAYENKAVSIIKELSIFTFELFEKHFLTNRIENDTISNSFDKYISILRNNQQIGTAVSYECSKRSLEKFDSELRFTDVTPELLRKYERWMLDNGKSITTVGMYIRQLRTIFNIAINDDLIPQAIYPFGKKRYEIPTGINKKKAITLSEIGLIYDYPVTPGTTRAMARDYWLFQYFCNGMNTKDMCLLKYKNIQDNIIQFERAKTMRTKRTVEQIRVFVTDDVRRIIKEHGNKDRNANNYIFPVLRPGLTVEKQRQLIQQTSHLVSDHMKEIAKELAINKKVNVAASRHSFATILQRSGVSTSFISEALGHTSEKTTKNYLAGFEDNQKMEAAKVLTAFKNTETTAI